MKHAERVRRVFPALLLALACVAGPLAPPEELAAPTLVTDGDTLGGGGKGKGKGKGNG